MTLVWLPSLTSLEMTEAEVTGMKECYCDDEIGEKYVYSFEVDDKTYKGSERVCTCSGIGRSEIGESVTILFDADKPKKNVLFSDLVLPFVSFIVGCVILICFGVLNRQAKEEAMIKKQLKK